MAFEYDVAIIGSGVAGALCATKLVESQSIDPKRIVILEAGRNGLDARQRDEFHRVYVDDRAKRNWFGPYSKLASKEAAPWPEKPDKPGEEKYFDQQPRGKEVFKGYYLRAVAGSTWSWRGNTPRNIATDFTLRTTYQQGDDWPITYA